MNPHQFKPQSKERLGAVIATRLPESVDPMWRERGNSQLLRVALVAFMLRHGWIDEEQCPVLPYVGSIRLADKTTQVSYTLAENQTAAGKALIQETPGELLWCLPCW